MGFVVPIVSVLFVIIVCDGGAPLSGWSSWNVHQLLVTEKDVLHAATQLNASGLQSVGYNYVLIDDVWTGCTRARSDGTCLEVPPRNPDGSIPVK
jgi:hypothetical protein